MCIFVIIRATSFKISGLFYCLPLLERLCLPWCLVDAFTYWERLVAFVCHHHHYHWNF